MICAEFFLKGGSECGFRISGHAGYDRYGHDIVCASVTSAVQLTVNGVTEILEISADLLVEEDVIQLLLREKQENALVFVQALKLHLTLLQEEFPKSIRLTCSEVS